MSMAVSRRVFCVSTMTALAAPAVIRAAAAAAPVVALKLHHAFSSVSCVHDGFLAPWARAIEAQSGGRIRVDLFPSMQLGGQPAELFDQARDRVADIVWAMPSKTPGRFPKIETFELPFVPSRRALVSSRALEDFAGENLKDEFREVHPICFSCADRGVIHTHRPIESMAAVKGLRLAVRTGFAAAAVEALGARAVPMPSAQLPMAIARRVVDGSIIPWDMVPALKLDQLCKAHTDFADFSLSTATFVLAMNKISYARLPPDLKKIIDDNSGQVAAGMAGAMWDLQAGAVARAVSERGDPIVTVAAEAVTHWRKATEGVVNGWLKQMKERRIDGGKLLAKATELLDEHVGEPEPRPPQPPRALQSPQNPAKPVQPAQQAPASPSARAIANPPPKVTAQPPAPARPAVAPPRPVVAAKPVATPPPPTVAAKPIIKPAPPRPAPPQTLDIPM
jgi:TRAP-type C4-dicarboxylate transport system substrate-binding protein